LRIIYLIFIGLITNICFAQEKPLELASLDTSKQPLQTYIESEISAPKDKKEKPFPYLNLNNYWNAPYSGNDYWDDYIHQPSYRITIEYVGLQRAVYKQLERLANRYYKQQLRIYWDQSYLHPLDLNHRIQQYHIERLDTGGHWWDRRWYDSLPPEKGGEISIVHQIGSKVELIRVGPLSFNNEGKFSWQTWKVDIEDNKDTTLSDIEAFQTRAFKEKYNVGIRSPEAGYVSDWYECRISGRINVRVDNLDRDNKSEIGLNLKFNLLNRQKVPYLRFQSSARIQPLTGKAEFEFQLSLLEF